jgi:wobble nucleotide-excising tRNase
MITRINLNKVACYKCHVTLETDKKVNLIYGLNGTGKSTLTDYLYDMADPTFSNCSIEGLNDEDILVYNQSFIRDYFYEADNLKGIFTLSKENKEVEEKIRSIGKEIDRLDKEKIKKVDTIEKCNKDFTQKKQKTEDKIWEIKTNYSGGDRVLEYCLSGLMGRKESLFNYLSGINKPTQKPERSTDKLKREVESIKGSTAQKYDLLPILSFVAQYIETNQLFQKVIIGNENSAVAGLITKLGNSDWVKQGLNYLPDKIDTEVLHCPFCQEITMTKNLLKSIQDYFDRSYENDISELQKYYTEYDVIFNSLQKKENYEANPFIIEKKSEFENLYNAIIQCQNANQAKIAAKLRTPSQSVALIESTSEIRSFNQFIENINIAIKEHNTKIDNKDISLAAIKNEFWEIMRWDYDQTLAAYKDDKDLIESKIKGVYSTESG